MDSLLPILLLLGSAPAPPPPAPSPARTEVMASARIVRAAVVDFAAPGRRAAVRIIRTSAIHTDAGGQKLQLQEFH
ncbi:hypothetical protein [Parasphingorhabdus sp.]|uniref:hypothetical protein n=1 Tax=Parasphingorhabdus sp. TaxID=2709688 RepID=UPI003001D1C8